MNRQQRRAHNARLKMQKNAERLTTERAEVIDVLKAQDEAIEQLGKFRMLLFALARREGRVLVRREDINALGENDKVNFVQRENGDVVVEYTAGAS